MSVQFGRVHFDGKPVDRKEFEEVRRVLAPYGPDGEGYICRDNLVILHRAFHTTKESRQEIQPHILKSGAVITWDGRLDNRSALIQQLGNLPGEPSDLEVVSAGYECWGKNIFAKLIGDWALSVWDPQSQSLLLATDFVGARHLYYMIEDGTVAWCTVLDALLLSVSKTPELCEEYMAGWITFFPAPHLTPYRNIRAVPPSHAVQIKDEKETTSQYWDFDLGKEIRYQNDSEYERHFRAVFAMSVRRRLRCQGGVLAELSGGMDSSSIVCMADSLIARNKAECGQLDTVSYHDDSEPNWNESHYFHCVETARGRVGFHVDVGTTASTVEDFPNEPGPTPGSAGSAHLSKSPLSIYLATKGHRVVLSGIGGDEVTGGNPTPVSELADLLAAGSFRSMAESLKCWALIQKKPWFYLLWTVTNRFSPLWLQQIFQMSVAPWLRPKFFSRHRRALSGYQSRLRLFGARPSFQENLSALGFLRRQLAARSVSCHPPFEVRYPYLDRDLVEFLFAIPRDQLVRPGQRRSLMRRSLTGIVPDEILQRRRKAYLVRGPMKAVTSERRALYGRDSMCSSLGIVDEHRLGEFVEKAERGEVVPIVSLLRTFALERWLRGLQMGGVYVQPAGSKALAHEPAQRSAS